MKQLIILSFFLSFGNYATGQIINVDDSNIIDFTEGDDPWNGDLCAYVGDPSSGIFEFDITGFNAVSVTISTSNVLVVPISNSNLSMNLDFATNGLITGGTVIVNPIQTGQSTIIITAFNSAWEPINFYLDITAKACRNTQNVRQRNINPLNLTTTNVFSANNITQTIGNVTIPSGSDIEFIAGNDVILNPGFTVDPGAEFLAEIGPCISR